MIRDNYSITKLFVDKAITIFTDAGSFIVQTHSVKEFYNDDELNSVYHFITLPVKSLQQICINPIETSLDAMKTLFFDLGKYGRYMTIVKKIRTYLPNFLPQINIDMSQHLLSVNGITITDEIWEYILYILKLSCGEKVNQPLTFTSEEARKFYLAQREKEEKINKLKQSRNGDKESLLKIFLSITYAFPSITIDYLYNQTMAQIQWLQKYAAGAMSYEVNAKAFAAGNMKKGSKLDFFIK